MSLSKQLKTSYQLWLSELPQTLFNQRYSNPYCTSIPDGWFETTRPRILVVGEEGFGLWGNGRNPENGEKQIPADEFETLSQLNYRYLHKQLGLKPMEENDRKNLSAFWQRFRQVAKYGVCAWTNIDKIHVLSNKNCKLSQRDRKLLHSVSTRILQEEINALNPTHIIFFGWYRDSLAHELPELYTKLYPGGANDSSLWKDSVVTLTDENRTYIFAYHPGWRGKPKDYEDRVIQALVNSL